MLKKTESAIPFVSMNKDEKIVLCKLLRTKESRGTCYAEIAKSENDEAVCSVPDSYSERLTCKKTYEFANSIQDFFSPKIEKHFNETLDYEKASIGIEWGNCVYTDAKEFFNGDKICFKYERVKGFKVSDEGYVQYES